MNQHCKLIVFSDKAYNAIIDETFTKDPVETGGILLGHILDNGMWIVMEVLPPGLHSIHEYAYFEYDEGFVNYLANSVASKYEQRLSLLGIWHRHPESMDYFSSTDDGTNAKFASINPCGAISGLVNVDPKFRLTMRHVSNPLKYEIVHFEVGDDIIPEFYFELKHYPKVGLHPEIGLQQPNNEKKNSEKSIVPTLDQPYNLKEKKENFKEEGEKTQKRKLFYWIEKGLTIIGVVTLLYLVYSSFSIKSDTSQEANSSFVEENKVESTNKDEIVNKPLNDIKKNTNGRTKETKEKTNSQPTCRNRGQ